MCYTSLLCCRKMILEGCRRFCPRKKRVSQRVIYIIESQTLREKSRQKCQQESRQDSWRDPHQIIYAWLSARLSPRLVFLRSLLFINSVIYIYIYINAITYKQYKILNLYMIFDFSTSYGPETKKKINITQPSKISHTTSFYNRPKFRSLFIYAQYSKRVLVTCVGTKNHHHCWNKLRWIFCQLLTTATKRHNDRHDSNMRSNSFS